MGIPVLRLRGQDGQMYPVAAIRGEKGTAPVRGVDYFTDGDKQEIVAAVLAALPSGDEEAY